MATYIGFLRAINLGATRKFPKAVDHQGGRGGRLHRRGDLHQHRQRPLRHHAALAGEDRGGAGEGVRGRGRLRGADDRVHARRSCARSPSTPRRFGHGGQHYVSLLKETPTAAAIKKLEDSITTDEVAKVGGRAVHLLLGDNYHEATLTNAAVEKHLGVATNRNLTVIRALAEKWG